MGLSRCPVSLEVNDKGKQSVPSSKLGLQYYCFVSPVWPSLEKQDLNSHTLYFSSLEFSFKESVS